MRLHILATLALLALAAPSQAVLLSEATPESDLSECRDAVRVSYSYWQGSVIDERDQSTALLGSVATEAVHTVERVVQDPLGLVADFIQVEQVVEHVDVPATVNVAWHESYVAWTEVTESVLMAAPVGVATPLGTEQVCDPEVAILAEMPALPEGEYISLLGQPTDGWLVHAAVAMATWGEGDDAMPMQQGRAIFDGQILAAAEAALRDVQAATSGGPEPATADGRSAAKSSGSAAAATAPEAPATVASVTESGAPTMDAPEVASASSPVLIPTRAPLGVLGIAGAGLLSFLGLFRQ